jgi:hypothetical protein
VGQTRQEFTSATSHYLALLQTVDNFGFPNLTNGQPSRWLYINPYDGESYVQPGFAQEYNNFRNASLRTYEVVSTVRTVVSGAAAIKGIQTAVGTAAAAARGLGSTVPRLGSPLLAGVGATSTAAGASLAPGATAVATATATANADVLVFLASYMSIGKAGDAMGNAPRAEERLSISQCQAAKSTRCIFHEQNRRLYL